MLKLASLAEIEGRAGESLLDDRHHRDEHLRGDRRVELDVLVDRESLHLLEGLLHEALDFPLLEIPFLLIHGHHRRITGDGAIRADRL